MHKKIIYRIVAICLPILFFAFVECMFRVFAPIEQQQVLIPKEWEKGVFPAAGMIQKPFFFQEDGLIYLDPSLTPFMKTDPFSRKPTAKRIFCFGGSATLGVPFEGSEFTFPAQLQKIFQKSGEDVEVINMGGASFASDHVLALVEESLKYEPNALVVYSGNNEFFNHMLSVDMENQHWKSQPPPLFHSLTWLQRWLNPPTSKQIYTTQQERWVDLLNTMISEKDFQQDTLKRDDAIQDAVVQRYIKNLKRITELAQKSGVTLIIATVPSNLHTPPAISKSQYKAPYVETSIEKEPWNASLWYQQAQKQEGEKNPSLQSYKAALNLDLLPGRPNDYQNQALIKSTLPLLLIEIDQQDFHDSCHLTKTGYQKIASQIHLQLLFQWHFNKK